MYRSFRLGQLKKKECFIKSRTDQVGKPLKIDQDLVSVDNSESRKKSTIAH
jgi:hypothetical protein